MLFKNLTLCKYLSCLDQPLFAVAKQVQWSIPSLYGEDKYIIMLPGKWMEGSAWVEAIVQAKIATQGTAESFFKACHVTKTVWAFQITVWTMLLVHFIGENLPGVLC